MRKILKVLDFFSNILYKICLYSMVVSTAIMAIIVFARVVLRFGMSSGFQWSEEIAVLLMMWMAFFGGSTLFYDKANISVTVLIDRLPIKMYKYLKIIFHIATIAFLVLLLKYGIDFAILGKKMIFGASGLQRFWSYLSIPVGALFALCFESIYLLHEFFPSDEEKISKGGDAV